MKIAVYANEMKEDYLSVYERIFTFFDKNSIELLLADKIHQLLIDEYHFPVQNTSLFGKKQPLPHDVDVILSIGGDGTFLSAVAYALELNIPVAGINCGRLGFLADINSENLEEALGDLLHGNYELEYRSLLQVVEPVRLFKGVNYAINELTVHKLDNSSMIKIETLINGEFLANYWADGLIISTPTGSTAYSLSVGGPIVIPDLAGLIITPIASHNLTVRPVVVPDDVEIELHIEGRGNQFLVSFDHRSEPCDFSTSLKIKKAPVNVAVVKLPGQSFYATLRNKLMWGADRRN